jgi:SAM-dependent methyltransferase
MLWRSDFQNARQLLIALAKRADRKAVQGRIRQDATALTAETFHRVRQARAQRARTLSMLLIELDSEYGIGLRRAPDVRDACLHAFGPAKGSTVISLRELLGVIGAHQWTLRGIDIPAAGGSIHPHYAVFAPTRADYVDLIANAPLPFESGAAAKRATALDLGTGTGVLAAVLARRGVGRIVASDADPRAIDCARRNIERLGLSATVEVRQSDMFPEGQSDLVVCNPPWVPARPGSALERGIYDEDSRMLRGFLAGLAGHLTPGGEGWLILSDLAEHLGLRSRETLLAWIDEAGLEVAGRHDTRARHPKSFDHDDPFFNARRAEVTSLWRLRAKSGAAH